MPGSIYENMPAILLLVLLLLLITEIIFLQQNGICEPRSKMSFVDQVTKVGCIQI